MNETMAGSTLPTQVSRALDDTAALLPQLSSNTDLAGLVERVARNELPWVVVPAAALRAWEERDSDGWAKVSAWLASNDVASYASDAPPRRVTVPVVAGVALVLPRAGPYPSTAEGPGSVASVSRTAGEPSDCAGAQPSESGRRPAEEDGGTGEPRPGDPFRSGSPGSESFSGS